ncbi:putative tetratricopeptide repeat protein 36 [Apostichopus japonicus]|uniref:Putative tetratricopeptide repeat protein 36 n=1 Tax=Stichopus japonicus TaxID=307972 RepID=A0A2G8JVI9_STIJA|nr:putative tetratricopeptide repeat protein 36 [Apostichopus japonicus]
MSSKRDKAVLNAIFNPLLPVGSDVPPEDDDEEITNIEVESENVKQAKALELEGVHKAEASDFAGALELFNQAVQMAPDRSSCYNNRAQLLRLKGDVPGALEDLNMAIMLSNGQGKPACQAFTQRGMIYRLEGQDDQALNDFKRAAALGGEFARSQVVLMNPYAAMCNKMLSDVISKLRAGEYVD